MLVLPWYWILPSPLLSTSCKIFLTNESAFFIAIQKKKVTVSIRALVLHWKAPRLTMVEPPETPLQAIVVEITIGAGPEAVPEELEQVFVVMLRADECLSRLLDPRGHTHNGASIARGSRLEGGGREPRGLDGVGGIDRVSRCRRRKCYSSMVGRASVYIVKKQLCKVHESRVLQRGR